MEEVEEWRRVADFPDYSVSSFGRVRRDTPNRKTQRGAGTILTPSRKGRYPGVNLHRDGKQVSRYIHILVCTVFHGPCPSPKHEVAHWDGEIASAGKANLRWATRKQNMDDMIRHGRTVRGDRSGTAKLTWAKTQEIRDLLARGYTHEAIAADYGVSRPTISLISKNRTWREETDQ